MRRRIQILGWGLMAVLCSAIVWSQTTPPPATTPSSASGTRRLTASPTLVPPTVGNRPIVRPRPNSNQIIRPRPSTLTNRAVIRSPLAPPAQRPTIRSTPITAGSVARPQDLEFDAKEKTVNVGKGETKAEFKWAVTNISTKEITVLDIKTSCGCTAARLPTYPNPWVIKPSEGGEIGATMDLTGKYGTVAKTVTVITSTGAYTLLARSILPEEAFAELQQNMNRSRNLQIAAADRQAVFRNDCASCHVEPGIGKVGKELYGVSCGICHDAEHKASMVTELRGRPGSFPRDYWMGWIRNGKEGSLMPAFDTKHGGPLTEDQIESLADYLVREFPKEGGPLHGHSSVPTAPTAGEVRNVLTRPNL